MRYLLPNSSAVFLFPISLFLFLAVLPATSPAQGDWNGTEGDDVMTVNSGQYYNNVYGLGGNDVMTNNNRIWLHMDGGDGNDVMTNNSRANQMMGGSGDDVMTNNNTVDSVIEGGDGNDVIINRGTADMLNGENGNDRLENSGTVGHSMLGMDGNDAISMTGGTCDRIIGGNGDDTVVFSGGTSGNVYGDFGGAIVGTNALTLYGGVTSTGNVRDFQTVSKLGAGIVSVNGELDLEAGSLSVEMHGATTQFIVGSLAGATGTLTVTMQCGGWTPGQTANVFSTGAVGTFASESVSSSALHNFSIAGARVTYDGRNSFTQFADTENALAVAQLLDAVYGGGSGDMATVFGVLDRATAAELTQALNQMIGGLNGPLSRQSLLGTQQVWSALANRPGLGTGSGGGFTLTLTGAGGEPGQVDSRAMRALAQGVSRLLRGDMDGLADNTTWGAAGGLDLLAQGLAAPYMGADTGAGMGLNMGPQFALTNNDFAVWMRLMAGTDQEDERNDFPGSDANRAGVAGGLDMRLDENWQAGLHVGYTLHFLSLDDASDSMAQGWTLHAGGSLAYDDGPLALEAVADWFHTQWQTDRAIYFGTLNRTANADVAADGVALSLSGEYDFELDDWRVTPLAGVDLVHQRQYAYAEHGAGALNLHVDVVDSTSLRTRLGASVSREFEVENSTGAFLLTPEVHAQWRHEFLADSTDISCDFEGGGSFQSATPDPDRDTLLIGVGITLGRQDSPSFYIQGDAELGARSVGYGGAVGLRIPF